MELLLTFDVKGEEGCCEEGRCEESLVIHVFNCASPRTHLSPSDRPSSPFGLVPSNEDRSLSLRNYVDLVGDFSEQILRP